MSLHKTPEDIHIVKINPIISGTKENVVKTM